MQYMIVAPMGAVDAMGWADDFGMDTLAVRKTSEMHKVFDIMRRMGADLWERCPTEGRSTLVDTCRAIELGACTSPWHEHAWATNKLIREHNIAVPRRQWVSFKDLLDNATQDETRGVQ